MGLRRINLPSWLWTFSALVLLMIALSPIPAGARQYKTTARISVSSAGVQGINITNPVVNGNGNTVAFWSDRGGLVPEDSNNVGDVFVRFVNTNQTIRVSLGFGGVQTARTDGNLPISYPEIDIDDGGCIIAYSSDAMNITAQGGVAVPDVNNTTDVFLVDICIPGFPTSGFQTLHVSKKYEGAGGQQANGGNTNPKVSGNGTYVIWRSSANNLLGPGGDTNNAPDIYRMNRTNFAIVRVNLSNTGQQANLEDGSNNYSINDDGNLVAFASVATNLVAGTDNNGAPDIYIRNINAGTTIRINGIGGALPNGASSNPFISGDGQYVTFRSNANNLVPGDTNGAPDIFRYELATGLIERVSVSSEGTQSNAGSDRPSTNNNGRYVSFYSEASNLVFGDTNGSGDIFVRDMLLGITTRASVRTNGNQANGPSGQFSSLTSSGNFIVFDSWASNIVANDTNASSDVFLGARGPLSPNNLALVSKTTSSISMSWNDNATGETSILVQRRLESQTQFQDRQTLSPTATTYTDSGDLTACTIYHYRVLSVADGIASPSNILTVKTPGCPPGPFNLTNPTNNEVVINTSRADFRWALSEEAITYTFTLNRTAGAGTIGQIYQTTVTHAAACANGVRCILVPDGTLLGHLTNGSYTFNVLAENTVEPDTLATNGPRAFTVNNAGVPDDFAMYSPAANTLIRQVSSFGGFTWQDNRDASTYALNVIQISNNTRLGSVISQSALTPAADADGLTCNFEAAICTYVPTSGERTAMANGTFTWAVTAKAPAGTPRESSSGAITFRINSGDLELLQNGGFEADANVDGIADGWTVTGATGDKRKCNNPNKTFTIYGNCAFLFKGGTAENSAVIQNVLDTYGIVASDEIQLNARVNTTAMPAGGKLQLTVVYVAAVPKAKSSVVVPAGTSGGFVSLPPLNMVFSGPIKYIKLNISNKAVSGKFVIDDVSLLLLAPDSPRRGLQYIPGTREVIDPEGSNSGANPVLPPPPPAEVDGFRGSN